MHYGIRLVIYYKEDLIVNQYDNKYIKNNIKIYNNRINANFLEVNKYFAYLSAILLESAVKIDNDYYLQIFLEECKYALI